MPKLYSYVVDHDTGFAPNPSAGLCTLAKCKFGTTKQNVVEKADEGDWIVGTGGAKGFARGESAGIGKLIYAMRVDRKIPLADYCNEFGTSRIDAGLDDVVLDGRFALLSKHYYYFGRNGIDISGIPQAHLEHPLEKKGPGFRSDFSESFIEQFATWLSRTFEVGIHGLPCHPSDGFTIPKCQPMLKRKARPV